MKKLSVLSLILAALMLLMMVPAMAADVVETDASKTDLLADAYYEYLSPEVGVRSSAQSTPKYLNDGTIAKSDANVFLNEKVYSAASTGINDKDLWKYSYAGRKYAYVIRFDLAKKSTVNGFSLWCSRDKQTNMVERQIDPEFDILVSKDNGKTWTVAWESVRAQTAPASSVGYDGCDTVITKGACFSKDKGGNMEFVSSSAKVGYAVVSADFTAIPGVTNVMYGCSFLRSSTSSDVKADASGNPYLDIPSGKFSHYCSRISEFDVYGTVDADQPAPATGDNTVVLTVAAAAAMLGAAYVCKKKLFD